MTNKDKTEAGEFWIGISKTGPMALSAVLTKEPDANDSRWDEVHHVIEATKLREWKDAYRAMCSKHDVLAARVETLEAENSKLRAALERIANANGDPRNQQFEALSPYNMIGIAKHALGSEGI